MILKVAIAKAGQNIIYQHTGLESMVCLDPNLIRNCMINLISNAIEYSGEQIFIEFNTEITDNQIMITVKDDGGWHTRPGSGRIISAFF